MWGTGNRGTSDHSHAECDVEPQVWKKAQVSRPRRSQCLQGSGLGEPRGAPGSSHLTAYAPTITAKQASQILSLGSCRVVAKLVIQ